MAFQGRSKRCLGQYLCHLLFRRLINLPELVHLPSNIASDMLRQVAQLCNTASNILLKSVYRTCDIMSNILMPVRLICSGPKSGGESLRRTPRHLWFRSIQEKLDRAIVHQLCQREAAEAFQRSHLQPVPLTSNMCSAVPLLLTFPSKIPFGIAFVVNPPVNIILEGSVSDVVIPCD